VTTQTLWILVAVVVAIVIIAVALGLVLRNRRRISLREAEQVERGTDTAPPRRGGSYQASGGISFAGGTDTAEAPPEEPAAPPAPKPTVDDTVFMRPPAPAPEKPRAEDAAPTGTAPTSTAPTDTAPTEPAPTEPAPTEPAPTEPAPTDAAPADTAPAEAAPAETAPADTAPTETTPTDTAPTDTAPAAPAARPDEGERGPNGTGTATAVPPAETAPSVPAPADTNGAAPAAPAAPEIAPAEGRLERLRGRLARSRSSFGQGLLGLLGAGELDEESWEDVETMLLQADLGPEMTLELVETLRTELAARAVRSADQARQLLREVLTDALHTDADRAVRALPHDGRPAVVLVVGVNGTGKTTTTGKLARVLVAGGRRVVLGAADTFRAAAAEQLATWGERAGATVVRGPEGADPASVAFDAVKQGTEEGADAVLLDTAGRLHTKTGLMDELGKVKRVVERQAEVDEVLLVLDATTGQNGLTQARVFGDVVKVTGIVLTKLDGTAKGGIVFRVQRELGVPVKLVGLGEGPDDLAPFEPAAFVDALLDR